MTGLLAMAMMVSCGKDDPTPNQSAGGNGGGNTPQVITGDGVYNPSAQILFSRDELNGYSHQWVWTDGKLVSIAEDGQYGAQAREVVHFNYSNGRVSSIIFSDEQLNGTLSLVYANEYIQSFSLVYNGMTVVNASVEHNSANKVSHVSATADASFIENLMQFLGNGFGDTILSEMLLSSSTHQSKMSFNSLTFDIDFVWNGNNVDYSVLSAECEIGFTLSELSELVDLSSYLGSSDAVSLLMLMYGDTEIPITIGICDTVEYTYDNHTNPLQGLMSQMTIATLSANNTTEEYSHGSVIFSAQNPLTSSPISFDRPVPESTTTYTIQYNGNGLPIAVTDDTENTVEYEYKQ